MELLWMGGLLMIGVVLTKMNVLSQRIIQLANKWIIYVALPAVALGKIPQLAFNQELLAPVLVPLIVFFGSVLFFYVVLGSFLDKEEKLVLSLLGGLGNTSFLGFPLIGFYYKEGLLVYAAVLDQMTFFLMATMGQWMLVKNEGAYEIKSSLRRIFSFPPFLAALIALMIPADVYPEVVEVSLNILIKSITPIAMVVVGYQIAKFVDFQFTRPLVFGLFYKLALAPLILYAVLSMTSVSEDIFHVCVIEAGMASQITISILVLDKHILTKLTSQMLCWSIICSFLTTYIWYLILN